jgi:ABC-2 type transport system ATP-binding protein
LAERFQLDLGVKVRNMSRGMRQKLGLILALAHKPRILILDEPTVTLDPLMQAEVQSLLRQWSTAGHTVFFSSHTLGEVEQLCDRVAMIRHGRLVADESLDNLRKRAGHEVTIRWRPGSSIHGDPPPSFELMQRDSAVWHGMYTGPIDQLVAWLADKPLDDLTVGRPDLETLFRQYYASEPATP